MQRISFRNLIIDASNIHAGGGQTHLIEILRHGEPASFGFEKIMVCAPSHTLARIEDRPWLEKLEHPYLDKNYFFRWRWRNNVLPNLLKTHNAFLFCAATIKPPFRWPYVTICQNLLPIELRELFRFGFSLTTFRLLLLRFLHFASYRNAIGVIFLTQYCYNKLPSKLRIRLRHFEIIPHGLNKKMFGALNVQNNLTGEAFRLLYVSIINLYKHQDKVSRAVINLNKRGFKIKLTLIGKAYGPALKRLNAILESQKGYASMIEYKGFVPYEEMNLAYSDKHASIFASSCETFGMIVMEAMAMGMPLLCSEKTSLPETVGNAAIYFNPEDVVSIENAILKLYSDDELRSELSGRSLKRAAEFSWDKCSKVTFEFIHKMAKSSL